MEKSTIIIQLQTVWPFFHQQSIERFLGLQQYLLLENLVNKVPKRHKI